MSTSTIASYILQKMLGISTPDSTGASRLKILLDTFPLSHIVCQWVSEQQNSAKSLHPSTGFFCTSCTPDQASGWKPPVTLEKGALQKGCLAKGPWPDPCERVVWVCAPRAEVSISSSEASSFELAHLYARGEQEQVQWQHMGQPEG